MFFKISLNKIFHLKLIELMALLTPLIDTVFPIVDTITCFKNNKIDIHLALRNYCSTSMNGK